MVVANVLLYLDGYSRVDEEFSKITRNNVERPEISLIQGILYGYDFSEIKRYINRKITSYLV